MKSDIAEEATALERLHERETLDMILEWQISNVLSSH